MGKVIDFENYYIKSRQTTVRDLHRIQAMNRWYFRNRRLMQEAAEKQKAREELP